MWGKCVKQTAGILRWMDRVHLLGHSEVGRVGKNKNPQKIEGGYKYLRRLINWKGEKEAKEGKGRTGFCKSIFSSLWRRLLQRRAEKMSEALQHGFCVHLECTAFVGDGAHCTLYIIHCTSNTAQCTLRWRCCTGAAFEWPETGLLARLWDVVVHLSRTLQPLYLSTRSTLLQPFHIVGSRQGAAVRRMHLALPRVETSGFGSGLDSAWTDCVWSGLIKMDCCTNFVLQTAL